MITKTIITNQEIKFSNEFVKDLGQFVKQSFLTGHALGVDDENIRLIIMTTFAIVARKMKKGRQSK